MGTQSLRKKRWGMNKSSPDPMGHLCKRLTAPGCIALCTITASVSKLFQKCPGGHVISSHVSRVQGEWNAMRDTSSNWASSTFDLTYKNWFWVTQFSYGSLLHLLGRRELQITLPVEEPEEKALRPRKNGRPLSTCETPPQKGTSFQLASKPSKLAADSIPISLWKPLLILLIWKPKTF